MHAGAVCLDYSGVTIYIDYKSRKEVTLTVNETIGIVVGTVKIQHVPQVKSLGKACHEEVFVYNSRGKIKHAHSDAPYLVVTHTYGTAIGGPDLHDVALFE